MKVRRLGIGLEISFKGYKLALDPPKGYKGFSLFSGTFPIKEKSGEGSYGPFRWEVIELKALRGKVNAFLIRVEDVKLLYAGGALELPEDQYQALALASGGTWYMDPLRACRAFKESPAKAFLPTALWKPGISLPLEGLEEVRDACRGLRRVRARVAELKVSEERTVYLLE